jgi:hypothetical protein
MKWKPIKLSLLTCAGATLLCFAILGGVTFLPDVLSPKVLPTPRALAVNLDDLLVDESLLPLNTEVKAATEKMPRDPDIDLDSKDNLAFFSSCLWHQGSRNNIFTNIQTLFKQAGNTEARMHQAFLLRYLIGLFPKIGRTSAPLPTSLPSFAGTMNSLGRLAVVL